MLLLPPFIAGVAAAAAASVLATAVFGGVMFASVLFGVTQWFHLN